MAERSSSTVSSAPLGHLTVHLEDERRPQAITFGFERQEKRFGGAMGVSFFTHIAIGVVALLVATYAPKRDFTQTQDVPKLIPDIVWLNQPGPGGGGGGGGNRMQAPPRRAELPGKDKISVPVAKPPEIQPLEQPKEPPKVEQPPLDIPAMTMGASEQPLPGVLEGTLSASLSQGPGSGGGAGSGNGTGIGPGNGSGLGPGWGSGTGGGPYRLGAGIETPIVLREVKPQYTSDAMRAKVQGTAWVECVVMTDGTVGECKISRSLDSVFGLDQEAVKAAKQWRFVPGKKQGQPVPVLVLIELSFKLH